jgi:uncharacterized protein YabN with tetrapyrrole methylase and pyrophosphatase domain
MDASNDAATGDAAEASRTPTSGAELVVVGTGIQWAAQVTRVAEHAIRSADSVLFAVTDPWAARWVRELNSQARSFVYRAETELRRDIYESMVGEVMLELQQGRKVCAAFYGSPTLFAWPAHEAIRRARSAGIPARMLPGVSSLECLFADLGIDPADAGCQIFEADHLLMSSHPVNRLTHLVLLQIAMIGNRGKYAPNGGPQRRTGISDLMTYLARSYPLDHPVIAYEAATSPLYLHRAECVPLQRLRELQIHEVTTLYVPPVERDSLRIPPVTD